MKDELRAFVEREGHPSTAWIREGALRVYLRKSRRIIRDESKTTFEIANVSIDDERKRGKGRFKAFLEKTKNLSGFEYLYVENVQEERFQQFFVKDGWTRDSRYPHNACYFLAIGDQLSENTDRKTPTVCSGNI